MTTDDPNRDDFYRQARGDLPGPLAGVRVLEVATTWAGPRCGALLADYGADVVKIEPPDAPDVGRRLPPILETNPPASYVHTAVNRNKRCVTLDLRIAAGREIFLTLARQADVIVENLRPDTMAAWGCGFDDVRRVRPDVVYVSISGFGQYGPYRDRGGYDPMAQAMSGVMWLNAQGDDPPMKAPIFLADELAALHATIATLAALGHRGRTGEGQHVDVSLLDAMISSSTGLPTLAAQGVPTPRLGNLFPFSCPANAYRCRDGWVYAGVLLDAHWRKLAPLIGRAELADDPRYRTIADRVALRPELDAMLSAWCAERTREQVVTTFVDNGLTAAPVLTPAEMVADPHVAARQSVQAVKQDGRATVRVEGPAAKMSRTPVEVRHAARAHGADTDEVLGEIGIDAARRRALRDEGVV